MTACSYLMICLFTTCSIPSHTSSLQMVCFDLMSSSSCYRTSIGEIESRTRQLQCHHCRWIFGFRQPPWTWICAIYSVCHECNCIHHWCCFWRIRKQKIIVACRWINNPPEPSIIYTYAFLPNSYHHYNFTPTNTHVDSILSHPILSYPPNLSCPTPHDRCQNCLGPSTTSRGPNQRFDHQSHGRSQLQKNPWQIGGQHHFHHITIIDHYHYQQTKKAIFQKIYLIFSKIITIFCIIPFLAGFLVILIF